MARWMMMAKKADFEGIAKKFQISPVLARVIRNRDVITEEEIEKFLQGTRKDMHSPWLLKDMDKAVELLIKKIEQKKPVRIVGDYDIDGVCSTFILKKGLELAGAVADAFIPNRIEDGYGMNNSIIDKAKEDGIDTIITCDNGIAAAGQVKLAKDYGMTVIITDHHEVPYEEEKDGNRRFILPPADAVVDPKQEECTYPFPSICGGLVAYKLIEALYEKCGEEVRKQGEDLEKVMDEFLAIAAFATVGDVMELLDENRIVVKEGLRLLEKSDNLGIRALLNITGLNDAKLSAYHIGFVLGPCINATGRLDMAQRALKLLLATDKAEAATIAAELKDLNESRKEMTLKGVEEAILFVENNGVAKDKVLVVYLPDCHESLAGIIAGRLRERYDKPVFVLTDSKEGVKGSGRSVEAYHMYENMTKIKDIFTKYGGHKMAAGLSLPSDKVEEFRKRINEVCTVTEEEMESKLRIDVPMPISYANMQLTEQLAVLEPFGNGNPKPVFAQKNITLVSARLVGKEKNVLKLLLRDETGFMVDGVCFSHVADVVSKLEEDYGKERVNKMYKGNGDISVSIAYYPDINEYAGRRSMQMIVTAFSW